MPKSFLHAAACTLGNQLKLVLLDHRVMEEEIGQKEVCPRMIDGN